MTPGIRTTEFWLSLAALIVGFLIASGVFSDGSSGAQVLAVAASALTAAGYSVSRGMVKRNSASTAAVLASRRADTVPEDPTQAPSGTG